jgi:hypothetical protein
VKVKLVTGVQEITNAERVEAPGIKLVFGEFFRTAAGNGFHDLATSTFKRASRRERTGKLPEGVGDILSQAAARYF